MKIDQQLTPEAVLAELGRRLARRRLDLGLTQTDTAERAGVGKRTLERIERGADSQLSTIIRLLGVLELEANLEGLVPEPGPRPMDLLALKGKERRRASAKRGTKSKGAWHWGDSA